MDDVYDCYVYFFTRHTNIFYVCLYYVIMYFFANIQSHIIIRHMVTIAIRLVKCHITT